jgi:nitrogenase molybdenum-iron protein beta chain
MDANVLNAKTFSLPEDYTWSEQQRVSCAVGGIYTALAIERVLPIMHCGPGCQGNVNSVLASTNGGQNADTYLESVIPSTNFCEADVVFGGQERLRKLVDESIRYYDADMFVVVDGCTAEIVGDDIEEVARDFSDAKAPVIYAPLPGFKGNNLWGHSQILNAIIDQYLPGEAREKIPGLVNVFGVTPFYDTFWVATLERLEQLLRDLGLEPNIIYGRQKGITAVDKIPSADFNLVISPWVDLDIARKLEDRYGTPFLHYPVMPTGPTETAKFIRTVVDYAKLTPLTAERYIREAEDRYYYYINHFIRWIYTCRVQPKEFFINSSAVQALSLTRFLINDLGFLPRRVFINEDVPEEHRERIRAWFRDVDYAGEIDVTFTADGGLCDQYVKSEDTTFRKTVVLGTTWDELTAKALKIPFVPVSSPYGDTIVGLKNYFGYDGGFALLSDIYNDAAEKGMGTVN